MTSPQRLLRLYPRAWRDRYGDEFLELIGDEPLRPGLVVDIVSGAIDARWSRAVRHEADQSTRSQSSQGGAAVLHALKLSCAKPTHYTIRDGLVGGAVMIAATLAFVIAGQVTANAGYATAGEFLRLFGLSGALFMSMPFWLFKGQSRRAQVLLTLPPVAIIAAATWISIVT